MKILVGCEYSGIVSTAFRLQGHEAYSCDLEPGFNPKYHLQMDVFEAIKIVKPDMGIFHPPCTFLCRGSQYIKDLPGRNDEKDKAVEFVKKLAAQDIEYIAIENPVGLLTSEFRKYDQLLFPWQYGDNYSKDICLWLKNLPPLKPIIDIKPDKLQKVSNHVNGRMSQKERQQIKSRFFPGIAAEMAKQWGQIMDNRMKILGQPGDNQVKILVQPGDNRVKIAGQLGEDRGTNQGQAADMPATKQFDIWW